MIWFWLIIHIVAFISTIYFCFKWYGIYDYKFMVCSMVCFVITFLTLCMIFLP